jgi:hypothetical protein
MGLTVKVYCWGMSKKDRKLAALEAKLRRLARSLGHTGFISQGSVFERKKRGSGSRYQWTWKDPKQKTLSLTLSAQQFDWLQKAIAGSRAVERTLKQMRRISRQVLLNHVPGPRRRKQL